LEASSTHDAYIVFAHVMLSQSMGVLKTPMIANSAYVMDVLEMSIQLTQCLKIQLFGAKTTKMMFFGVLGMSLLGIV
jgi:hypothetical protein